MDAASQQLHATAEELASLCQTLRGKARELHKNGEAENLEADPGLDFLSTKVELLLSYCIDITYYQLLKIEGGNVSAHPVVEQLLLLQGVLERLRPLDLKMKHQLDRLIRLVTQEAFGPSETHENDTGLQPRLGNLLASGADDEDGEDAKPSRGSSSEVYQPPKLAAVPFEEDSRGAAKEERRLERMRGRLQQSETLQSMRSEVLGLPEEVAGGVGGVAGLGEDARSKLMAEEREKEEWETDHMVRRQVTKKERQHRKRLLAESSRLETIGEVGDVAMVWAQEAGGKKGAAYSSGGKKNKKRRG
jgi:hypothetical protein